MVIRILHRVPGVITTLLFTGLLLSFTGTAFPFESGIQVSSVQGGRAQDEYPLQPGDRLLRWESDHGKSGLPAREGRLETVFDWVKLQYEERHKGPVTIHCSRDGKPFTAELLPHQWKMEVEPLLLEKEKLSYNEALGRIDAGELEKAKETLSALSANARRRGEHELASWFYLGAGKRMWKNGGWDDSEQFYDLAVQSLPEESKYSRAYLLMLKAFSSSKQHRFDRSLDVNRESADLLDEMLFLTAQIHSRMGADLWRKGDLGESEGHWKRALEIRRDLAPGSLVVAESYNNLGILAWNRGNFRDAEAYYGRALKMKKSLGVNNLSLASTLNNLANIKYERGDLVGAEDLYEEACSMYGRESPGSIQHAKLINHLGIIADERGDLKRAKEAYAEALETWKKVAPSTLNVALGLTNLGGVFVQLGNYAEAENYYREAETLIRKLAPKSPSFVSILVNLADLEKRKGETGNALQHLDEARKILQSTLPGSLSMAEIYHLTGEVRMGVGESESAGKSFESALKIIQELGPGTMREAELLYSLGGVKLQEKKRSEALIYVKKAVDALEIQREMLGGTKRDQERFSEKYADYYRLLIDLFLEQGEKHTAFEILEKFRARTLLAMLEERDLDLGGRLPEELEERYESAREEIRRVRQQLNALDTQKDEESITRLLDDLDRLREESDLLRSQIVRRSPGFASLVYPQTSDVASVQSLLPEGALFLSYCVSKENLHIFAITNDTFEVISRDLSRAMLDPVIRRIHTYLSDPDSDEEKIRSIASDLYEKLISSSRSSLRDVKQLIICPDGPLHYLPFSVLVNPSGDYLIETVPISYAISGTVLREIAGEEGSGKGRLVAAFGDPSYGLADRAASQDAVLRSLLRKSDLIPLPYSRKEVEYLGSLFKDNSSIYLGEDATEEKARALRGEMKYIHFACHALLDERFPLESGIVLTIPGREGAVEENGILQVWEIFEALRFDADVVTLSACRTALGVERGGEGVIGLTRAFLYAGARSVVSSMWSIADAPTAEFMREFYGNLAEEKRVAESLQLAMVDAIESGGEGEQPRDHPFYWAAFVLNGLW